MRLIIGDAPDSGMNMLSMGHSYANYNIDLADGVHEMKVPSGTNTGLKIVGGFDINENQTTELILDFDAMRSVVKAQVSAPTSPDAKDQVVIEAGTLTTDQGKYTLFLEPGDYNLVPCNP